MAPSRFAIVLAGAAGLALPAQAQDLPAYTPDGNAPRASVPAVYQWNLNPIFASDAAWEAELTRLQGTLGEFDAWKGQLSDPKLLLACLGRYFELHDQVNHVTVYTSLKVTTAQMDPAAKAMADRAQALLNDFQSKTGFIRAEVMALSDKTLTKAYARTKGLDAYRRYLDDMRRRRTRVLDADAERILSLAGDNLWAEIDLNEIPANPETTFNAALGDIPWPRVHDDEGKEVGLTLATYPSYRTSLNREVRKEAVTAVMGTLRQYQDIFASTLAGQAAFDVFLARSRNYDTALEAYLDKDNLKPAIVENLVATVNAHLDPLHRYVELRRKIMGLDQIHLYDLYVPMIQGVDLGFTYPQALEILPKALAPLGDEYIQVLSQGIDARNGWVDLYPHADKDSGAFSAGAYGVHPYVMMNYQDKFDDLSTLAHEYGHAMHSHYSQKNQSYADFRYVPFLGEIASTTNEVLLSDYLLSQTTDPRQRATLLVERLESIRRTIYRQTLFAEFEWKVHQMVESNTSVTPDLLRQTYGALITKYYGPSFTMDENDAMEWAYVPHFYWKYYVFNYATGLSSAVDIARRVQKDPAARDAYLGMLKAGCSAAPLDILQGAGVDLTQPAPIVAALQLFDETLSELEPLALVEIPRIEAAERAAREAAAPPVVAPVETGKKAKGKK